MLPNDERSLPRRGLWGWTDQRWEKRKHRKRRNVLHCQAGSVPEVPNPQVSRMQRTVKEMGGGVGTGAAGGAQVAPVSVNHRLVRIEGGAESRPELGQCRAMGARK